MIFTLNVSVTLSADDKQWLEKQAVDPIVAALNGIRDAVGSQEEMLAVLKAIQAEAKQIDPQTKG